MPAKMMTGLEFTLKIFDRDIDKKNLIGHATMRLTSPRRCGPTIPISGC